MEKVNLMLKFLSISMVVVLLSMFKVLTIYVSSMMVLMYIMTVILFLSFRGHFFMLLMALELMMMTTLILLMAAWDGGGFSSSLVYFSFLVISVCEATMGLSILIKYSRFWGNELMGTWL